MRKYIRHTDELIALQDKAIQALQQALLATQLALEALQKDRNERGYQEQWNGQLGYPTPNYGNPSPFVPYPVPNTGWTMAPPITFPTITLTNANGQVYKYDTDAKEVQDKTGWILFEEYNKKYDEYAKAAGNASGNPLYGSGHTKAN